MDDLDGYLLLLEVGIDPLDQPRRPLIELLLQRWPVGFHMVEDGQGSRHGQRMLEKGAGKQGLLRLWKGCVTIIPHAAVEDIHIPRFSSDNSDRRAAANDLAVGDDIRANVEPRLRAARVDAKAGHHLVKDQWDAHLF